MTGFSRRATLGMMAGAAAAPLLARPALAGGTSVQVGAISLVSHSASFVAMERGYFADAGLAAELVFFQAAQPMAVAIASRDVDFGVTAVTGGLINLAEKGATKVIGGALTEEPGITGQKILVSDKAWQEGVRSPADLDGRSWAVTTAGSSFHYMGSKIAQAEGVSLQYTPLQAVGAIIGSLRSGQVDAWSIQPHIASALAASGEVHVIGDVADYLPDYQVTTVFTSAANAADDRAKVEAFLAAFSRGADDFNAALVDKTAGDDAAEEMVQLIHKYVYTDRTLDAARPSILSGAMRISKNATLNMGSMRNQLDWFQSEGLIRDDITLDMLVDPSYVETV